VHGPPDLYYFLVNMFCAVSVYKKFNDNDVDAHQRAVGDYLEQIASQRLHNITCDHLFCEYHHFT